MTSLNSQNTPANPQVFEVSKTIGFEAAHHLPASNGPDYYKSIHGHSFQIEVTLRGTLKDQAAWVRDLGDLSTFLQAVKSALDHKLLNEIEGLENPTLEAICAWVGQRLMPDLPQLSRVSVLRPSLGEKCTLILKV